VVELRITKVCLYLEISFREDASPWKSVPEKHANPWNLAPEKSAFQKNYEPEKYAGLVKFSLILKSERLKSGS
jgi:hypothetical protein